MRITGYCFLFVFVLLSSCNFLAIVDRKQVKKFNREGITAHTFLTDDGARHYAHYKHSGKPVIMLLHGYGASGIGQYYRTALALQDDYDVFLPDLLYCGHTRGNGRDYAISDQLDHLKLMIDSLSITDSMVVVGNSYGGIVAAYFAEKYPELTKKLVIYDSPVNFYSLEYADSLARSLDVESVRNLLSPLNIRENRISLDIVFHDQPYIPRFLRRQMVKYGSIPARKDQVKLLDDLIVRETELNHHHFAWKCSVYVIWGEYDKLIPMQTRNNIISHYEIPAEQTYIFRNAAHAANVEHPDEFISLMRKIMEE